MEFLEQNFYFQSMKKTETNCYQLLTLKLTITKVKTSELITFYHFYPKNGQKNCPKKCDISNYRALNFHIGISLNIAYCF